ncbi:hypothetical protein DMC01_00460 [Campylobacter troglodytis]|nr:hypothetical protein DMC01_00460 [Campylobacter troglodytis]
MRFAFTTNFIVEFDKLSGLFSILNQGRNTSKFLKFIFRNSETDYVFVFHRRPHNLKNFSIWFKFN